MKCRAIRTPDGKTMIVCGSSWQRPPECFSTSCGKPSEVQCDFPGEGGKTCDRYCCRQHAKRVGSNKDYCLEHWVEAGRPAEASA